MLKGRNKRPQLITIGTVSEVLIVRVPRRLVSRPLQRPPADAGKRPAVPSAEGETEAGTVLGHES